jgi:hypothetical protein
LQCLALRNGHNQTARKPLTTAAATSPQLPSDPAAQSHHLSLLVARLQTRPGEDVLAELAACAGGMGQEAWDASFSKVGGSAARAPALGVC